MNNKVFIVFVMIIFAAIYIPYMDLRGKVLDNDLTLAVLYKQHYDLKKRVSDLEYRNNLLEEQNHILNKLIEKKEKQPEHVIFEKDTIVMDLPKDTGGYFKTYMDYRAITNKSSKQWQLQTKASTLPSGLRTIDNSLMVAVGSYYGKVGDKLRITLENDVIFTAVIGDLKQDRHTDTKNQYALSNKDILEFIVDVNKLDPLTRKMGDVSYAGYKGKVIKIEKFK